MAQRAQSAGAQAKSAFPLGYDDPKVFDKRVAVEIKKVKDLLAACERGKAQMEGERKAYCEDFKKHLVTYIADESLHKPAYVSSIQNLVRSFDELNGCY